jgi:ABC-type molybdate transport system ATPase subunit
MFVEQQEPFGLLAVCDGVVLWLTGVVLLGRPAAPSTAHCTAPGVAPAGALAEDPKLLLLDELTTFLDVEDQFGVLEAVKSVTHQRRDVTAVWVTHR